MNPPRSEHPRRQASAPAPGQAPVSSPDLQGPAEGPRLTLDLPALTLPRGGGAIKSIDEQFTVNPSNGTASLSLPLPLSPARNGWTPPVSLRYDSGTGNGIVGVGWSLDLPSIRRRTDRQLPRYGDDDVFLLQGQDELVPAATWNGVTWTPDDRTVGPYRLRRYRPRIESDFARIEQITHPTLGTWWRVTSRDNFTTIFGPTEATRIAHPGAPSQIFQWLPSFAFDDQGNCAVFEYKDEDLAGVATRLSEANRRNGLARFANKHLKAIRYGNRTPYFIDDADPFAPVSPAGAFLFHAAFDYGDHDPASPAPTPTPGRVWAARSDAFSSYRSGFDIRTNRLLQRVLVFHQFDELAGGSPTLVRSLDLAYGSSSPAPRAEEITCLRSARQCGYTLKPDGTYDRQTFPAMELDYEPLAWNTEIRTLDAESAANLPIGLGRNYEWLDLFGEGISGVFTEIDGAWLYKANLGDPDEDGRLRFDAMRTVLPRPSFSGVSSGTLRLDDLDASGHLQAVIETPELQGYFDRGPHGEWLPFRSFESVLRMDLGGDNLRRLDLDGDGRADLLVAEEQAFVAYRGSTRGYESLGRAPKPSDEERGPAVVFSGSQQTIFIADMTGDGLLDIVRIRNGDVCYWPNLGYGQFGAKVAMDAAPVFDRPDLFDARNLHLADVSGTGATDLLYLGPRGCHAYLNLSGNAWSRGEPLEPFFPTEQPNHVAVADLLGNGTACVVWSSSLPAHAGAPVRYMDLMGGRKPHLLRGYVNNLGKEVSVSYKSSTWYYLRDKREGRPWATPLPFPVHCLRRSELRDRISGARMVSEFDYRHGYFDRAEREFRGFGLVEQRDAESFERWVKEGADHVADQALHQMPVLTKTWFHTGAPEDRDEILSRFREEYWDREMARQGFAAPPGEPPLPDARLVVSPLGDPDALSPLRPNEWRDALRSCRGMVLRRETFGLDAPSTGATAEERQRQLSPYTVETHNCLIELLQPSFGAQRPAFAVKESESITSHYDRTLDDPRVEHTLNVAVDEHGHVLEAATVAYGRRLPDATLPQSVRDTQARPTITYVTNEFTGDVAGNAHYRLKQPSRVTTFELSGLARTGPIYRLQDFASPGFHALTHSVEVPFQDALTTPPAGTVHRRLVRRQETLYYDAAAQGAMALGSMAHHGLPFEHYLLAFTPPLLAHLFGARASDPVLSEGRYVHRGDANWWVPSGRWEYAAAGEAPAGVRGRFFTSIAHVDACGIRTALGYAASYFLLRNQVDDAAGNRTRIEAFDFATLTPLRIVDANDNISEVMLDALGRVKAVATRGKGAEADDLAGLTPWSTAADDAAVAAFLAAPTSIELTAAARTLLQHASLRYVYDLDRYRASGAAAPPVAATMVRAEHFAVNPAAPVHVSFEYSNGLGRVEMTKVQAEPGLAQRVRVLPNHDITIETVDTAALVPPRLRWLGTGRRVVNNKGNPVKQYEPFFSATHLFENQAELVESGVTTLHAYDAVGRVTRIEYPDATFSRVEYAGWRVTDHDRNDTVLESAWHSRRVNREIDAALTASRHDPVREQEAATQTTAHAATPRSRHVDARGLPVYEVEHNGRDAGGQDVLFGTIRLRDVEGRVLEVRDARGNTAVTYAYDMQGRLAGHTSMDGGRRWMLDTVAEDPLRSWDERGHEFVFSYDDPLHRPTTKRVRGGDGAAPLDHVFERVIYGEGLPGAAARNLRGRAAVSYDSAGRLENDAFDFKGNLLRSSRRFAADATAVPNWDGATPDAALLAESFATEVAYDGLDRVSRRTTADGSVYLPEYNDANLLERVRVTKGAVTNLLIAGTDHDEHGQLRRIAFGNGVTTSRDYDAETFRLLRLHSESAAGIILQDLHYTYDPVGNVTHLEDRAVPAVWFDNSHTTGLNRYSYDALYQLVAATGREHVGQADTGPTDDWRDAGFRTTHAPTDPLAWRTYTEEFAYDATHNLTEVRHVAAGGNWTRGYQYAPDSNRLHSSQVGASVYAYGHHAAHGIITSMPHLTVMRWNFRDELQATSTQSVGAGQPETTWYVYDGHGTRVRKVTLGQAAAGATPRRRRETFYLNGAEIHREYDAADTVTAERTTVQVTDDVRCFAAIESEGARRLVRYQCTDHLSSSHLETDASARVIAYEVYRPFGATAYQAVDRNIVAAARRYRFTGMERDEESGLEYHSARYYVPWLGRWIAPDLHAEQFEGNRYAYVKNNPVINRDSNGLFEEPVHGILTYRLALAAGIPAADAARIALATAGMDHDAATSPATEFEHGKIFSGETARYHFRDPAAALADIRQDIDRARSGPRPADDSDLEQFGRHLHTLEDVGFVDAPGPHMRASQRSLTPFLLFVGIGFIEIGATLAHIAGGLTGRDQAVMAVLATLFIGLGLYTIVLAIAARDIGHPVYQTERGEQSHSLSHVADQAPQDPRRNTAELLKIYEVLKDFSRARNGTTEFDDEGARAAIQQAIDADNSCLISAFANQQPVSMQGERVASYVEILSTRRALQWAPHRIDATLPSGRGDWRYQPGVMSCPAR
jgi:RHS repeat-associated protein